MRAPFSDAIFLPAGDYDAEPSVPEPDVPVLGTVLFANSEVHH